MSADVAVVGGGVIGLSVAWKAAAAGMSVTVYDPEPGRGASWAAAGMLAPSTEARYGEEALSTLSRVSAQQWPTFAAELEEAAGRPVGLRTEGAISVAFDADDYCALVEAVRAQREMGFDAELLSAGECRQLEPGLNPRVVGGTVNEGDHQVDNRAVVGALLEAVRRHGARFVAEKVVAVAPGAVRLRSREEGAGHVVVAAGCWSSQVHGLPDDAAPVRPVKGQILRLQARPSALPPGRTVRADVQGRHVYLVPRTTGEVVVGATMEEQGFDTSVTAGAVHDLLRAAIAVLPDVAEMELAEAIARLRPGSPDNGPVLGPVPCGLLPPGPGSNRPDRDGRILMATGHFRHGVLLTPVTASTLTAYLTGAPVPDAALAFVPDRFLREPA